MADYSNMSQNDFDRLLKQAMDENKASDLLLIPGVYEAVSEHFNNDVLTMWEQEQEEESDES